MKLINKETGFEIREAVVYLTKSDFSLLEPEVRKLENNSTSQVVFKNSKNSVELTIKVII